jgi:hypothetical protein
MNQPMDGFDLRRTYNLLFVLVFIIVLGIIPGRVSAWSEHPLMVYPALKNHLVWEKSGPVSAQSLRSFLISVEEDLELFLAQQEEWSRSQLPNYAPCPDSLRFSATGNPEDILQRFFTAIRINPNVKIPLYLVKIDGNPADGELAMPPGEITTLRDVGSMNYSVYIRLEEGAPVLPFEVLYTASDEPDYGFDLRLFEDNNTEYGKSYGFGNQSFGNPNLEYSSQAPFHMGFFHEAGIIYKFAPFMKQTYIDYRIFLYKSLSEFAFRQGHPYWGWRFMGWGMHYVGDVSMPYHSKPLPGVSTSRMLWINLKSILGAAKARENAIQRVSNRHTVFEEFQGQELRRATRERNATHPFMLSLKDPLPGGNFTREFLTGTASGESAGVSGKVDKALKQNIPYRFVSDPALEASQLPDLDKLLEVIRAEKGDKAVSELTATIAGRMKSFAMQIRTYMDSILADV